MQRWLSAIIAIATSVAPAFGAPTAPVKLSAQVFVEQQQIDANGGRRTILTPVQRVSSGDRLVFVMRYRNAGSRAIVNYAITNMVPAGVRLDGRLDDIELSADGGRNWGRPGSLMARGTDGRLHPAGLDEVTLVRWVAPAPIAPGAAGQISYRGVVR